MYSSISTALVVVCVILPLLASFFVALRFKVRSKTKFGYGADDWIILVALITEIANAAQILYGAVAGGVGDSPQNLATHPEEVAIFEKILFASPMVFAATVSLIKISTLILYKRIFIRKDFHLVCNIMMGVIVGWFLASEFGEVFATHPVSLGWTSLAHNSFDYSAFLLATASLNLVLDLATVGLPLFVIRTLNMTSKRKILVSGMFLLGLFCVVTSIVRLYYFVVLVGLPNGPKKQEVFANNILWSIIEPCTSIIAACLPTLAPLFRGGRDAASLVRSVRSILSLHSLDSDKGSNGDKTGDAQENQDAKRAWKKMHSNQSHSNSFGRDEEVELDDRKAAVQGIKVETSLRSEVHTV